MALARKLEFSLDDQLTPAEIQCPVPLSLVEPLNRHFLRSVIVAQKQSRNVLPLHLGLSSEQFDSLLLHYFPYEFHALTVDRKASGFANGQLRQELLELRRDECREVENLLLANRNGFSALEIEMAAIVAAGCLGGDHLWRDLGLQSRHELRLLLDTNFRPLVIRNSADMKWKKFFYKQLCEQDGGYVCRAPSCAECAVFHDCFGLEE
jgi:nitrogen fixation protein NifQ